MSFESVQSGVVREGWSVKALLIFHIEMLRCLLGVRRHSTYFDTLKSQVHTVLLRLFHLFHFTSYCKDELLHFN